MSLAGILVVSGLAFGGDEVGDAVRLDDLPMTVPNFRLEDHSGKTHELHDYADRRLIVLVVHMNGCPIVRQSVPYLAELREGYGPTGVPFLLLNCNRFDDRASVAQEAEEFRIDFPILMDRDQVLAHTLRVSRSAETIVIDPETWDIVYRGKADDRFDYGLQRMNPEKFWLRDILDGKTPATPKTVTKGCLLGGLELPESVDFSTAIAPILAEHFPECLRNSNGITEETALRHRGAIRRSLLMNRLAFADCAATDRKLDIPPDKARRLLAWLRASEPNTDP